MPRRLPLLLAGLALAGLFAAERARPLRRPGERLRPRLARNLAMGASCAVVLGAVQAPLLARLAAGNARERAGLTQRLPVPPWARDLAAFLLMDWMIHRWHVLTHRMPALWGLHRAHHDDRDMDFTTAMRFHAVDMLVSMPWRLMMVAASGASPRAHRAWDAFFTASVLFHHANLRLPWAVERRLARVLTTPRMHGIHHHADAADQLANFSSGLSFWDRLHGMFRLDRRDAALQIGLPRPGHQALAIKQQ